MFERFAAADPNDRERDDEFLARAKYFSREEIEENGYRLVSRNG
jgi:hypothetical protein